MPQPPPDPDVPLEPLLPQVPEYPRLHLDPEFVSANYAGDGALVLCGSFCVKCNTSLREGQRPPRSISTKHDLGNPARAGLPQLSLVERLCIARYRVLSAALHFRSPTRAGMFNALRGSAIVFATNGAEECSRVMPQPEFVGRELTVVFEGPKSTSASDHLEGFLRRMGTLRANADYVLDWIRSCHFLHPQFENVTPAPPATAAGQLAALVNDLVCNVERVAYADVEEAARAVAARADVLQPVDPAVNPLPSPEEDLIPALRAAEDLDAPAVLVDERFPLQDPTEATRRALNTVRAAVPRPQAPAGAPAAPAVHAAPPPGVRLGRDGDPANEYEDMAKILHGALVAITRRFCASRCCSCTWR